MTEGSMPWTNQGGGDGNTGSLFGGDEYSATTWHDFFSALFASDDSNVYVLPSVLNDLEVTETGTPGMSVDVATGEAFVDGVYYRNNASNTVTISTADPANPRIDRVVLRVTRGTTQTVRLAIVEGTAAASPTVPSLTQTSALYEVDLAHVYVPAAVASIIDEYISDKRSFSANFFGAPNLMHKNLLSNTEFLAGFSASVNSPASWDLVSTPSELVSDTKPSQMARGHSIKITADGANEGISQTIPCLVSTTYTIKVLIKVTSGDIGKIQITDDGTGPPTITREIRRTGSWLAETIRYTTTADATELTVSLYAAASGDIVWFGQCLVVEGYDAGPFRQEVGSVELLGGITINTAQASITFSDLPDDFHTLELYISGRGDNASTTVGLLLQFNGDTGNNYDSINTEIHEANSVTTDESLSGSSIDLGNMNAGSAPANIFSTHFIYIPDYTNDNKHTAIGGDGFQEQAASTTNIRGILSGGRWKNTAAITSLVLSLTAGNFDQYTEVMLYGKR